jgi:hypothetical protein
VQNILKELNSVFQLVSSIPVTGDAVDTMAVTRAKLRKIHADLKKLDEEVPVDGPGT